VSESDRYFVVKTFHAALGWMSEIRSQGGVGRILVVGVDHQRRAEARAAELNRAAEQEQEAR
jgi:hypothetical protein